jgi:DNA-binding Lrp family transcriptional regulator
MNTLKSEYRKIARLIQKDIPVQKFPFKKIGKMCETSGNDALEITKQLIQERLIRKFGAILRHQKAGYINNALAIWAVPEEQIEKVGGIFASFPFISHCYQREPAFMDRFNLFTMLHAGDRSISSLIKELVTAAEMKDYLILKSVREFKKSSPEYF